MDTLENGKEAGIIVYYNDCKQISDNEGRAPVQSEK